MEYPIIISNINDFIFCPASIYFHNLYGNQERLTYQNEYQLKGTQSHEAIDNGTYSTRKDILTSIEVFSDKYGIAGKIDIYNANEKSLTERKRRIKTIYDGYIFQLYAQYFAMIEAGFEVKKLYLYSMDDNKKYPVSLPDDNPDMLTKFEETINDINSFNLEKFAQTNAQKCQNCIYEPACDRSISC